MRKGPLRLLIILSSLVLLTISCGKVTQEVAEKTDKDVKTFDLLFKVDAIRPTDPRLNPKIVLHKDEQYLSLLNEFELNKSLNLVVVVQGIKENEGLTNLSWGKVELKEAKPPKEAPKEPTSSELLEGLRETVSTDNPIAETSTDNEEVLQEEDEKEKEPSYTQVAYNQHKLKITASNYNDAFLKLLPVTEENEIKKYQVDVKAIKIRYDYDAYVIKVFSGKNKYRLYSFTKQTAEDNQSYTIGTLSLYQTFVNTLFLTPTRVLRVLRGVSITQEHSQKVQRACPRIRFF